MSKQQMPTDPPPAAPSKLAVEIARQFADSEDAEMLTAIIDAKLKPVREAMEKYRHGHRQDCNCDKPWLSVRKCICGYLAFKDALASLSPQPPEARHE